jgi:hypothetical protein
MTTSKKIKTAFVICLLLESMNNIVNNLTTKADLSYDDIYERLIYYSSNKEVKSTDKAYY